MTETKPLRLQRLEIENFMRVRALSVDAEGKHVVISGPNGTGKTSAVDAIWSAFGGKSAKEMPEPVHRGAERASVRIDLGEYRVERQWTEKEARLVVTAADGSKVSRPQQLLDGLMSEYALNPVTFIGLRPQDQVDEVLAVVGVRPPAEEVRAITNEEHKPVPGESAAAYLERLSADEIGLYYVRRREAHRAVEQKEAALVEQRQALDRLGGPLSQSDQEKSATAILTQIEALNIAQDERREALGVAEQAKRSLDDGEELLASVRKEFEEAKREEARIDEEIARLNERLAQISADKAALLQRMDKGDRVCAGLKRQAAEAAQSADRLRDRSEEISGLRKRLGGVEEENRKLAKRRLTGEQADRLREECHSAEQEHGRLDNVLNRLRSLRAHLLDGIDLGVPGLEVGDGELRLNGVTFKQASMAQRVQIACAVAMRQKPRLRLLRIDEGERLDHESRELLLRLADEHDWQVVLTSVADTEGLKVEIVEQATVSA